MDQLYQDTKSLLVQLLRSIPPMTGRPISLKTVVEVALSMNNAVVTKTAQKVCAMSVVLFIFKIPLQCLENFEKLEAARVISAEDSYAALTTEVMQVSSLFEF